MKGNKKTPALEEITSLNVEDLDVSELEKRLELVTAAESECWVFDCGTLTPPDQPG